MYRQQTPCACDLVLSQVPSLHVCTIKKRVRYYLNRILLGTEESTRVLLNQVYITYIPGYIILPFKNGERSEVRGATRESMTHKSASLHSIFLMSSERKRSLSRESECSSQPATSPKSSSLFTYSLTRQPVATVKTTPQDSRPPQNPST